MKPRASVSRWLAPISVGATFAALLVAACSVPEFEFPPAPGPGAAGDGSRPAAVDHCKNKQLDADQGESDFDCGGACTPCDVGKHCASVADCATDLLCHDGACIGAGCMNSAQDGAETDVDCGGDSCRACITGQACAVSKDCDSGVCTEAKCAAPACDDQVENGKETGLDCGGDCPPCAANQPCVVGKDCTSGECNSQVCGSECADGFANCDKDNKNACEINTRTDLSNCGFCGNVCNLPHATAECSAGECRIATDGCAVGFQDCNGDPSDGCEVDLTTNKLNCGACNKVCPDLNGTPSCAAGQCQIACNDGFQDCDDTRDNGCEVNLKTNIHNCNACGKKCAADPGYSPNCVAGACGQTLCDPGKGDCNGDPSDKCETVLTNDVNNCGGCGIKCEAVNATVDCVNSKCVITACKGTFADCTGGYDDGCETDTAVSTTHCGACGKGCTITNGTPKCDKGSCEVNSCSGTFRDCDGDPKTGCEVNVGTNTKNCGGCGSMGSDCSTKYANAASACSGGGCTTPICNSGFGDCSGGLADGCETNTTNSPGNCGTCGTVCATDPTAHVSSNLCANSQCDPKCSGSYLSCDNIKPNGCEADSSADGANCGACGTVCSVAAAAHVTSNPCSGSSCAPQCAGTWGDCDTSRTNGCEVDTAGSNGNCGGCGKVCDNSAAAHVSSNNCSGSACHPQCSGLYDDCDNSRLNGCEKDVSGDVNNCGACKSTCGTTNASAGTKCSGGACNPTCDAGWGKCATPEQGCVTPLGTASNCTKCGEACNSPTKFCDPGGCVDHRDIVVVNSGTHDIHGWDGSGSLPSELTVNHTLQTLPGNNRMVLVGVVASDSFLSPTENIVVQYDGKPMLNAIKEMDATKQSFAGIYYLLDAGLPTSVGVKVVDVTFANSNVWGHGGFDVVELKNTMQVAPIATGVGNGGNCGGTTSRSATVTFSQVGSLVYGVMSGRGATAAALSAASGLVETWNQQQPTPNNHTGSAAYVFDDDNRTISWNVTNCYNSAAVIAAVKRLNWN